MKNKDLAAMLLQCDPEEEVSFRMFSGCCEDHEYLEVSDADFHSWSDRESPTMYIEFYPVPGYESCIQAGNTVKTHKDYWEKRNPETLKKIKERKGL